MDATLPEVRPANPKEYTLIRTNIKNLSNSTSSYFFRKIFGCDSCPYAGTKTCPHKIKLGGRHSNGICSFRTGELKELYETANSVPRLFQQDAIVKSQILLDHFRDEYAKTGKLHPNFHQLEKNLIGLLDKVRKQDEGIKIHAELTVTHDKLREIIVMQERKMSGEQPKEENYAKRDKQQVANASIFRDRQDT